MRPKQIDFSEIPPLSFFKTVKKDQGVRDEEEFDTDVLNEEWDFEPLLTRNLPS